MNIGFVSTWFERGAAYVTKMYVEALKRNNNVFVYARGGECFYKDNQEWNQDYVTWGLNLRGTNINENHFEKWIKKNNLDVIFFNEQREFSIVAKMKKKYSHIKFGAYIDYYTEQMIPFYDIYDFIICNTKRHYEAFDTCKCSRYYVKWGTNTEIYNNKSNKLKEQITFFHSMGMSNRKGTELLVAAFIKGELYKSSKLIIHTQKSLKEVFNIDEKDMEQYNIQIINKTIGAPGLYYMGDVYVYPTKLEGLGLTLYEALASGLPVITTNFPPMNEIIDETNGKLVRVERIHSRSDGYYWPLAICNQADLIEKMQFYIEHKEDIKLYQEQAREYALKNLNFTDRYSHIEDIFRTTERKPLNEEAYNLIINKEKKNRKKLILQALSNNSYIENMISNIIRKK
ncbi:MAG: glycosyltransferase family 4 protein [Clostridia bacterium]